MQEVSKAVDNWLSKNEKLGNCTCHIHVQIVVNIDQKLCQVAEVR